MNTVTMTFRYSAETRIAALLILPDEADAGPLFAPAGGRRRNAEVWLPLAEIEIEGPRKRGAVVKVTMPAWLAEDRGLT